MNLNPEIVQRLRSLFSDGATPGSLIEFIRVTHGSESPWPALVQRYFFEAFGVHTVRVPTRPEEYATCGFKFAHLIPDVAHALLQHRKEWDSPDPSEPASWLDGLKATDRAQLVREAQPQALPELAQSWPLIDAVGQKYIQTLMGTNNLLYEQLQIVSRLAECLQQRVDSLEKQLGLPLPEPAMKT